MRHLPVLVLALFLSCQAHAVTPTQVQAVFLEKFTRLIEWPETEQSLEFTICVLNNTDFANALEHIYQNKKFGKKDVNIIRLGENQKIPQCNLLFIGKNTRDIVKTLKQISGRAMLTVTDNKEYIDNNVMITMFLVDNRFKYVINNRAAQQADIKISYLLLKSAHEVIK